MRTPTVSHPTDRPNFTLVDVGSFELAFSYQTVVGFRGPGEPGWVVSENLWGPTTGKHLNWLPGGDDKKARCPRELFEVRLDAMLATRELTEA